MVPPPTARPEVDALDIGTRETEALSSTSEGEDDEEDEGSERQKRTERPRGKGRQQPSLDDQREVPMYAARAHALTCA